MVKKTVLSLIAAACFSLTVYGQANMSVFASGLKNPVGLAFDETGNLWVAEMGTGMSDGRVSVITNQGDVFPFVTGLPSDIINDEISGPNRILFDNNNSILILIGEGTDSLSGSAVRMDLSTYLPGDTSFTRNDILEVIDISDYVLSQGYAESNPYDIISGPGTDYFIVDAAANAIVKMERITYHKSIFAEFPDLQNNTGIGPPMINTVPTGIVELRDTFYVSALTGFPFPDSLADLYAVMPDGDVSVHTRGMQTLVDVELKDTITNEMFVLKFAEFDAQSGFVSNSGKVYRIENRTGIEVADSLNFPSAMKFNGLGNLYVSELMDGEILYISGLVTNTAETKQLPETFLLEQNYPNPFNPATKIKYTIPASENGQTLPVNLKVFDLLGNEIKVLVDEAQSAGNYEIVFDGTGLSSGVYFYRLNAGEFSDSKKLILMK